MVFGVGSTVEKPILVDWGVIVIWCYGIKMALILPTAPVRTRIRGNALVSWIGEASSIVHTMPFHFGVSSWLSP